MRKRKDLLAWNQDNVSKCGEMSTFTLCFSEKEERLVGLKS